MTVRLEVPATAEYVGMARMLASTLAVARRLVDEEAVDNLKLAVSEACTLVVDGPQPDRMTVTCDEDDEGLVIEVEGLTPDEESEMPYQIMRALVDKVDRVAPGTLRLKLICPPL